MVSYVIIDREPSRSNALFTSVDFSFGKASVDNIGSFCERA
jgi:hypothetical protein